MVNTGTQKLLRIGELSRRTGVSTSAINYYVREGLLPPPLKTAPNMAYYDPSYVDMINSIRVMQREKGLSLSDIRKLLDKGEVSWPDTIESTAAATEGGGKELDRRKHIIAVASKVFAEKGYYATTISDLAEAAGIAKGTIYWYFENKRSIMIAILDEIRKEIREAFIAAVRGAPNGLEAILRCVEPSLRILEKHGPIYFMYFLEIGSTDRVIQDKYREIYKSAHRGTKESIIRGQKEGVVRDLNPDVAAYAVMGMIERTGQVGLPEREQVTIGEKAKVATEMIRRALSVDNYLSA